ncbi:hypothetical protein BATDEDRAFT_27286 [Batrachochytrium dendrobatidis JAM81]|uniref:Peptidase A1 domain-containing protein n=1 Tax=Batrachochytrium dendrobatidis (strain JAM81 / FGSC 10211) TaxID=684364 RepID=F4PA13_BATDJ|nr:uncharacterized protein BATDEDRAFT_27286 [Batrachochytrium dendrobatidis JAM81]EGF77927.1 hypothetical protein BATDEDRAFT_27286 [Batrachochytrium dendrobatidis JAM81]|eukprot:XP_006681431.1 hypothetical protein BATDEDRAFT_27286 [Batrachochytrium dendrobatidis JAM81]
MYRIQPIFIIILDTMLITLECILLALQTVSAVRLALESPIGTTSQSNNRLSKRSPVVLDGDITKCYTIKVNVDGVNLGLQVDSSMADIVVPLPSSSNDVGLTPQHTPSGEPVTIDYKGEEYNGVTSTADVTIPGTRITDIDLPVIAVGIDSMLNGVFGFGNSLLSNHHPQTTAMDALYNGGIIPNNEVSLQLCPYEMTSNSFINIGNTDVTAKCGTDGTSVAWVKSPSDDQFTVNIKSILVNDEPVELPEEFQKTIMENGRTLYSSVETCFLYMRFPEVVVAALVDAILDSVRFDIEVGPNDNAILGIPFMAQLGLTFDRAHKRIGFGPGCGCEVATSKYPTISNGYRVLWPSSHVRLPEQPSTSGSDGTSTLRRSLSQLGSALCGSRRPKFNYKKFED